MDVSQNTTSTSFVALASHVVTHHITNDLANLSLHAPYDGTDELIIGDGSSLPISHIGSFSICTSTHSFIFTNM